MGKDAAGRIAGNPVAPRSFQTQDVVRLPESDGNLTVTLGNYPNPLRVREKGGTALKAEYCTVGRAGDFKMWGDDMELSSV